MNYYIKYKKWYPRRAIEEAESRGYKADRDMEEDEGILFLSTNFNKKYWFSLSSEEEIRENWCIEIKLNTTWKTN